MILRKYLGEQKRGYLGFQPLSLDPFDNFQIDCCNAQICSFWYITLKQRGCYSFFFSSVAASRRLSAASSGETTFMKVPVLFSKPAQIDNLG